MKYPHNIHILPSYLYQLFCQLFNLFLNLLLSGVGSVVFRSSFIVPVLCILPSILGAISFSIVALAKEVVDDRHIWLLSTSMMIIDKMIRSKTTDMRTIMIGRNLAAFRLSIPVVVAANCFSPGYKTNDRRFLKQQ